MEVGLSVREAAETVVDTVTDTRRALSLAARRVCDLRLVLTPSVNVIDRPPIISQRSCALLVALIGGRHTKGRRGAVALRVFMLLEFVVVCEMVVVALTFRVDVVVYASLVECVERNSEVTVEEAKGPVNVFEGLRCVLLSLSVNLTVNVASCETLRWWWRCCARVIVTENERDFISERRHERVNRSVLVWLPAIGDTVIVAVHCSLCVGRVELHSPLSAALHVALRPP